MLAVRPATTCLVEPTVHRDTLIPRRILCHKARQDVSSVPVAAWRKRNEVNKQFRAQVRALRIKVPCVRRFKGTNEVISCWCGCGQKSCPCMTATDEHGNTFPDTTDARRQRELRYFETVRLE